MRRSAIVGRACARAGAALGRTARARGSQAWTRSPARRGRRAWRAGSRTSCWPCAGCSGSRSRRRASATFSSAIASAVVLVLRDQPGEVVAALGDRGNRVGVSRRKRSSTFWSSASSRVRSRGAPEEGREVPRALGRFLRASVVPVALTADERSAAPRACRSSSLLNTWSRSTAALVSSVPMRPPSSISRRRCGPAPATRSDSRPPTAT